MVGAYKDMEGSHWGEDHIARLLKKFPKGQLAAVVDGKVVGCALSLIVRTENFEEDHTYQDITGNFTFDTHDPEGDILYGIDIFINSDYRGLRLGRRLYDTRKELCEKLNLNLCKSS